MSHPSCGKAVLSVCSLRLQRFSNQPQPIVVEMRWGPRQSLSHHSSLSVPCLRATISTSPGKEDGGL